MLRRLPRVVALLALLLSCEPLLHNHPLQPRNDVGNSVTCAVCVSGAHRLPSNAPTVAAPERIVAIVCAVEAPAIVIATPLPRASRAPPLFA
jgi:hypothetical protein